MQYRIVSVLLLCLILSVTLSDTCGAESLPLRLTPALAKGLNAQTETLTGAFAGLIVVPASPSQTSDPRYGEVYRAVCGIYAKETGPSSQQSERYVRRFSVYVPDNSTLPLAKRVGRLLLLLYGMNRERLKSEHPTDQPTVQVWLTPRKGVGLPPGIGGEQFGNQIFIYDIMAERSGIEWAREVAHEYGHFALPGISGFTEPEEWANGVLGERLFLKWLQEERLVGRLEPDAVPFLTGETLTDFLAKQVTPLVQRVVVGGINALRLTRRDAEGMDDYTALALYLDTVYGSRTLLDAMACTLPKQEGTLPQSADFLRGMFTALGDAPAITLTSPAERSGAAGRSLLIYLPAGKYRAEVSSSVKTWQIEGGRSAPLRIGERLTMKRAGWYALRMTSATGTTSLRLTLHRL